MKDKGEVESHEQGTHWVFFWTHELLLGLCTFPVVSQTKLGWLP